MVPPTWYVRGVQVTMMDPTATAPTVPEPLLTTHVAEAGCACTVTAYVAPSATACGKMKLVAFTAGLTTSVPLASTRPAVTRPVMPPPIVCVNVTQLT